MARGAFLLVVLGSAMAWILLQELAWPGRLLAMTLLVPLPAALVLQARTIEVPEDAHREAVYFSSALTVWVLAALAMLAARMSGMSRLDLRLVSLDLPTLFGASGLTILAGIVLLVVGRFLKVKDTALLAYLIPRTSSEKIAFLGVSVSAGIAEELVFRSFLIGALLMAGASETLAVSLSIGAFAAAHAYQGPGGALRVALLGAIVTAPYLITGSVYPSMIAHFAIDVLAGLVLADWLLDRDDPSGH